MEINEEKFTKFSEMSKRMKRQGYKWYCNTMNLDKGLAGLKAMYDLTGIKVAKVNETYSVWYFGKKKKL